MYCSLGNRNNLLDISRMGRNRNVAVSVKHRQHNVDRFNNTNSNTTTTTTNYYYYYYHYY